MKKELIREGIFDNWKAQKVEPKKGPGAKPGEKKRMPTGSLWLKLLWSKYGLDKEMGYDEFVGDIHNSYVEYSQETKALGQPVKTFRDFAQEYVSMLFGESMRNCVVRQILGGANIRELLIA